MATFTIEIAASLRAYGSVTIEAPSLDAAQAEAAKLCAAAWKDPRFPTFDPEYDTLDDFEVIDVSEKG